MTKEYLITALWAYKVGLKSITDMLTEIESYFIAEKIVSKNEEEKKECLHYFVTGYVAELVVYCKKCGKEIDDLYGDDIYRTHELKDGNLIEKK